MHASILNHKFKFTKNRDFIKNHKTIKGQALVEFLVMIVPVVAMLIVAGSLFQHEWNRLICAYATFEKAHEQLMGQMPFSSSLPRRLSRLVRIQKRENYLEGMGTCGRVTEKVVFPDLESAAWKTGRMKNTRKVRRE